MLRHLVILLALGGLTFFAGLGRGAIGDSDEAYYAEAAREMVESGDWLTPRYNYEHRFQKPILYYWLAALTYKVAGVTEAAARFPSALSGLCLALLTYLCGRRWFDPPTAALAGVIVATSFGAFTFGRAALPDLPLALFITLATWALIEALDARYRDEPIRPAARRGWLLVGALALGLAVLTKGPVGVALPVMTVAAIAWRERYGQGVPWHYRWPSRRDLLLAALVFVIVAAPWYVAMTEVHGFAYLDRFFVSENLERFATDRYNEPRSLWFYGPIVLGGLMPWSPFLLLWGPSFLQIVVRRERRLTSGAWRLVLWSAVPLIFYSLSIGKQPRYILPVLPPLALIVARSLIARLTDSTDATKRHVPLAVCGTLVSFSLLLLAGLLQRASPLLFALNPSLSHEGTAAIVVAGVAVLVAAWLRRRWLLPTTLAAASVITFLSLQYSIASAAGLEPVQRMAALYKAAHQRNERSGTYRVLVRNLIFYTGVRQTDLISTAAVAEFLRSPKPVLCVVSEDDLAALQAKHGIRVRRLGEVLYFNPSAVRIGTLLWPDPAEDLETVLLVTNQ
ncbi:MAG: phospholipid carrier-dependent glycosyltransferase [Luteitalea sp.]|nr:phospholipid carrier-dependent glycosyltransferase [Luteitalea sp.]